MGVNKVLILFLVLSLVANVIAISLLNANTAEVKGTQDFTRMQEKYPLVSKRILQELPQDILINFMDLRTVLRSQVAPYGDKFGLYFEYLPTGTSININGNSEFYAASLFKIPVIMAYLHGKERTGSTDDPIIEIKKEHLDSEFGDLWKKGAGTKMRASEAIRLAIVDSDNTAIKALIPYVQNEDFDKVYSGLDIVLNADSKGALISAKSYGSILKSLYFSSILNKDNSHLILELLTKTNFSDKMVAGVPPDVLVAHKIGDYKDDKGEEGYRDCGIVYVSRRPYLLCMVSSTDEQTARERMQAVSKTIYDYVANIE